MGSAWKAVQSRSNASAFGNDEDDASGMAWVKKRRAAREKAKLEASKVEPQPEDADSENLQPATTEEEPEPRETPRSPREEDDPQPPVETPIMAPAEQSHEKPGHITTAINLPPQRAHKREASFGHRTQIPQVEHPVKERPSFGVDVFDMDLVEKPEVAPEIPKATTDSTSEEDEEDEESSTEEEDEDESDAYSEVCVRRLPVHISLDDL